MAPLSFQFLFFHPLLDEVSFMRFYARITLFLDLLSFSQKDKNVCFEEQRSDFVFQGQ